MTTASDLTRRVIFQQRGSDANGDPLGAWTNGPARWAKVLQLKGGEGVQAQRLEGNQPVIITVRRGPETRSIDNSYRAVDARDPATIWSVTSATWNEADGMMEILAVQRRGDADV